MRQRFVVRLSPAEREELSALIAAGTAPARKLARVRRQYVAEGLAATLNGRAPGRVYRRKLDGAQEAQLSAGL
jgi:anti-sigma factor RsiW